MRGIKIPIKIWDPSVVMYLIIIDQILKEKAELAKVRPTERFFEMVREQVVAHVIEGKSPPTAIATAIMNISDDVMAGRDAIIRAGDYIALMDYARAQKMV
jgi:hypothetical protein